MTNQPRLSPQPPRPLTTLPCAFHHPSLLAVAADLRQGLDRVAGLAVDASLTLWRALSAGPSIGAGVLPRGAIAGIQWRRPQEG